MKYARSSFSRFIPILLVIVITIVAVAAVIAIGRSLLGGNDKNQKNDSAQIDSGRESLLATDSGHSVRLTVRGPIVSDERFRSYVITVSPDTRRMTLYKGYLDEQISTEGLNNNVRSYEQFVYALDKRKMMDGKQLTEPQNDLRGICATGKLYEFETLKDGSSVKKLWTSDCSGSKGSAQANVQEILDMFLKQIPGGNKMATDVGLNQQDTLFKL